MGQDSAIQGPAPSGKDAAEKIRQTYSADYVIWGSATVLGDEASLDVNVLDSAGKVWQRAAKSPVSNLIGGLQNMADSINHDVFGRPLATASSQPGSGRVQAAINPDFVMNENRAGTVYLNPQIRYQGVETDRLRSQMLNFESRGMAVADLDGDGKNEVLLIDSYQLYAFRWEDGRLQQIATHKLPSMQEPLLVRTIAQGGRTLIVLSCYDTNSKDAISSILTFSNNQFQMVAPRLLHYLNVVKLPPLFLPAIIGQDSERGRIVRGPIFEIFQQGDTFTRGSNLSNLPKEANVFNFAWVPGNERSGGDYLAVIGEMENLLTFDGKGRRLAKTDDRFSGSAIAIPHDRTMPGMGESNDIATLRFYYVPMRMVVADVDSDGRHELLVNKPISTAGTIFSNYRTYPQGEVHALQWDGIGMDLLWKTRRIKGTVVDILLADANNDGVLDLVVNVNTYAGATGTSRSRSLVTLYPLDTSSLSTTTTVSPDFDD